MNIKVEHASYEEAYSFFNLDNDWKDPNPKMIDHYEELRKKYSIFEYAGIEYRKILLFLSTEDYEGHVLTFSPVGGNSKLSQEEYSKIMGNTIAAFDSKGIKWKEM